MKECVYFFFFLLWLRGHTVSNNHVSINQKQRTENTDYKKQNRVFVKSVINQLWNQRLSRLSFHSIVDVQVQTALTSVAKSIQRMVSWILVSRCPGCLTKRPPNLRSQLWALVGNNTQKNTWSLKTCCIIKFAVLMTERSFGWGTKWTAFEKCFEWLCYLLRVEVQ